MRTKNYVNILLENGIHFNTISKMGKRQVRLLAEKFEPKEAQTYNTQTTVFNLDNEQDREEFMLP